MKEAGEYICEVCHQQFHRDVPPWHDETFHDFIEYFICADCSNKSKHNVRFKCNLGNCNKTWKSKGAISRLIQHLKKHHQLKIY